MSDCFTTEPHLSKIVSMDFTGLLVQDATSTWVRKGYAPPITTSTQTGERRCSPKFFAYSGDWRSDPVHPFPAFGCPGGRNPPHHLFHGLLGGREGRQLNDGLGCNCTAELLLPRRHRQHGHRRTSHQVRGLVLPLQLQNDDSLERKPRTERPPSGGGGGAQNGPGNRRRHSPHRPCRTRGMEHLPQREQEPGDGWRKDQTTSRKPRAEPTLHRLLHEDHQ